MSRKQGAARGMSRKQGAAVPYVPQIFYPSENPSGSYFPQTTFVNHDNISWELEFVSQENVELTSAPRFLESTAAASVLQALQDPRWDWRTLGGLQRSTKLDANLIAQIIDRNCDKLEIVESQEHGWLIRLRGHRTGIAQRIFKALDTILDLLSLGKRSIVQP